jgi:hypothetical protein
MTKDDILQRISQVDTDLEKVKGMPNADRHSESLRMYREYLLEQLAEIKDDRP